MRLLTIIALAVAVGIVVPATSGEMAAEAGQVVAKQKKKSSNGTRVRGFVQREEGFKGFASGKINGVSVPQFWRNIEANKATN